MKKPDGFDEADVFDGEFKQLDPGGYICVIKDAKEDTTNSGKNCLRLYLDIHEGPDKAYYANKYKGDKERRDDAKWGCIFTQLTEGTSLPYFKGMISSIDKSNQGYRFEDTFDENTLRGKLIGGVFGREQFQKTDGSLAWSTKCVQVRSVEAIREGVDAPKDKYLGDDTTSRGGGMTNPYAEMTPLDEIPF